MEEDPFVIVENQVKESLVNADNLYSSWKRIRQTVKSPQNQELLWTADELESCLEAIEQDLDDLDEALAAAKLNPQQFHLSANDLNTRQLFLIQSRNTIQSIRNTMANPSPKYDDSKSSSPSQSDTFTPYRSEQDNSRFIENEQQQQQVMFQEQDHHLDSMAGTLVNLKDIAGTMNREIDDHVILLDELGDNVDRTEGRLKRAMHRVTDILKKEEESKSGYCICCLIIILIILLVLVIII
ncbi:t-SNARE [Halteromyces radiatus]|uniref:t-SNARE n=1 Tax=Halteromyces radiatus TaxID=101107 RepID=UPI00221E8DE0|nr:t-SNARE [Halteromyces radiatus]KAI8086155.1 t-SNARE [Halteromyces radiatus]